MIAIASTLRTAVRQAGRASLDPLLRTLPRMAFATAGASSRIARALAPAPLTEADLSALLGNLSPHELRRILREIDARWARSSLLKHLVAQGAVREVSSCLRLRGFERLFALRERHVPAILVTWHTGPYQIVGTAVRSQGLEMLTIARGIADPELNEGHSITPAGSQTQAVAALKRAVVHLRAGGIAGVAGDGNYGSSVTEVTVLNRRLAFRHGFATLARLTGAPIMPIVASWNGGTIDVTVHEPLALPAPVETPLEFEHAVLHAAAAWFDGYLRTYPTELRPDRVRMMLTAPRAF